MSATRCPHCGEIHDTTGCPTYPKGISGPVPMTLAPTVYWHDPEPVGSPAYARRLRDGMVARFLERHCYAAGETWHSDYLPTAIERANDVVEALGYQVPKDGEATS